MRRRWDALEWQEFCNQIEDKFTIHNINFQTTKTIDLEQKRNVPHILLTGM